MGSKYKKAGVDISAGENFAQMIKEEIAKVWPQIAKEFGSFAGQGPIPQGAKSVRACVDGVGTKLKIAFLLDQHETIGIDAVAMAAQDLYMDGTRPLYVLDYLAIQHLIPEKHIGIIKGIIIGCQQAGCQLIGGETAELVDFYKPGEYDLAVFCNGFSDPDLQLDSFKLIKLGQKVYGWLSCGLGSNGYSLARKVLKIRKFWWRPNWLIRYRLQKYYPELESTLGKALLRPTTIYIKEIEKLRERGLRFAGHAHITGGGMPGNLPRILPENCKVVIDKSKWKRPLIFSMIQKHGKINNEEMDGVFNQGIQVVSIVRHGVINHSDCVQIGTVARRQGDESQVQFINQYRD